MLFVPGLSSPYRYLNIMLCFLLQSWSLCCSFHGFPPQTRPSSSPYRYLNIMLCFPALKLVTMLFVPRLPSPDQTIFLPIQVLEHNVVFAPSKLATMLFVPRFPSPDQPTYRPAETPNPGKICDPNPRYPTNLCTLTHHPDPAANATHAQQHQHPSSPSSTPQ